MKLEERKLGRENAFGLAYKDEGRIVLDPRLSSSKRMETLIHEALHVIFPDWTEARVNSTAKRLRVVLWRDRWRRVEE